MNKWIIISLVLVSLVGGLTTQVQAEEFGDVNSDLLQKEELTQEEREQNRADKKAEIEAEKERLRAEKKVMMEERTEEKEQLQEELQMKRDEMKEELEQRRAELQQEREEKQAEFKERLAEIKDEKKQEIVERVDERIYNINQRRTDHYADIVDKMWSLLDRFRSKLDEAAEQGVAVESALVSLGVAEEAISTAEAAVAEQASKDYTATIEDEETLREDVGGSFESFKSDLKAVHELLVEARQSLAEAAQAVAGLHPQIDRNDDMEASDEGNVEDVTFSDDDATESTETDEDLDEAPTATNSTDTN